MSVILLCCYDRPQILIYDAVELALEMHLMSQSMNFISVFNSMCAQASVNHLHIHSYYMNVAGKNLAALAFTFLKLQHYFKFFKNILSI